MKQPVSTSEKSPPAGSKTRYAICGLSFRGIHHFVLPLLGKAEGDGANDFSAKSEIVAILDLDQERVESFLRHYQLNIPYFSPAQGAQAMIEATKPDVLVVAGPDYSHCEYILAGLENDLDVIAEKPVVISCEQMQRVLKAEQAGAGTLKVAHNMRYHGVGRQIKKLILAGKIGKVTNVELTYNLDTFHGASYYYRWNRERAKSGGLSIHKSVHHIDLINWLIDSVPETVFAFGARNYYGPEGAHRPKSENGEPLSLTETRERCPYFQRHFAGKHEASAGRPPHVADPLDLPYNAQYPADTYLYDKEVDIEDTYSAVIRYQNGASLSYSCNFSTPWEGFVVAINGTHGRIEATHRSTPNADGTMTPPAPDVVVYLPLFGGREEYPISSEKGSHEGSDPFIQRDLFIGVSPEGVELGLPADAYAGAVAIAAGEAIWRSAQDGKAYRIADMLGSFYRPVSSKEKARLPQIPSKREKEAVLSK